jgi:hypothetical protein
MSLGGKWFSSILNQYFNIDYYRPGVKYDNKSTILCVDVVHRPEIYTEFRDQGFPIIIDSLWETKSQYQTTYPDDSAGSFILHNVDWFWYNESLWYKQSNLDAYCPARTYEYTALMPMRLFRLNRDMLHKQMTPYLKDFIWSYVDQGKQLPNDRDLNDWSNQRYFNPEWYDNTCFSLVSETQVDPDPEQPVFITEKTFKPMAFKHPFIIFGNQGTLAHLHSLGFETYENLFDESYDTQSIVAERLQIITSNVDKFNKQPYDKLTLDKIEHNHARFFDTELVKQKVVDEIILPILEYAKA